MATNIIAFIMHIYIFFWGGFKKHTVSTIVVQIQFDLVLNHSIYLPILLAQIDNPLV